jgi:cytochrome c553
MKRIGGMLLVAVMYALTGAAQGGDTVAGKRKAVDACADCHGEDGRGDKDTPNIAGMSVDEFTKAMKEYQAGVRTKSKKMTKAANRASDEDIADTAAYYNGLPK